MTAFRRLLLGLLVLAILASPVVAVLGGWVGGQHWPMKRLQVSAPFEFVGQAPVRAAVARHARAVVLIGRDGPVIREALSATGVPQHDAASLEDAVRRCAELAQSGDAVLLSPACASLDMFKNFEERGRLFAQAAEGLQ